MKFFLFERLARWYPELDIKLKIARMNDEPDVFVHKTFKGAMLMSIGVSFSLFLILARTKLVFFPIIMFPILFAMVFFYMMKLPDVKIKKLDREIGRELVFAGRFLIIEIQSGVPLYKAFLNIARNYNSIGPYFREIVNKIDMGGTVEETLNEAVELSPSQDLRRLLWQIMNSLRTGSDIGNALNAILEQIAKEQSIAIKEYGRKLNPLAMFYMVIAVILPSLGVAMLIILSTFIDIELDLSVLLFMAFFLGFIQYMFLAVIRFSRPAVEL